MAEIYRIEFSPSAKREYDALKVFDQRRIIDAIQTNLRNQPTIPTRNKKNLGQPPADFGYQPPLWELRIGEFRAFFDVDGESNVVSVRAVRKKPPHRTTAEVLNEATGD